jgi:hypothetical protein
VTPVAPEARRARGRRALAGGGAALLTGEPSAAAGGRARGRLGLPAGAAAPHGPLAPRTPTEREQSRRADAGLPVPLTRAAARLFLVGFSGTAPGAPFFRRLAEREWGAVLVERATSSTPPARGADPASSAWSPGRRGGCRRSWRRRTWRLRGAPRRHRPAGRPRDRAAPRRPAPARAARARPAAPGRRHGARPLGRPRGRGRAVGRPQLLRRPAGRRPPRRRRGGRLALGGGPSGRRPLPRRGHRLAGP